MRNRNRITFSLSPGPILRAIGEPSVLPESGRIIGVVDRGEGEAWCCHIARTGVFVALNPGGGMSNLPRHKVMAAIAAEGLTLNDLPFDAAVAQDIAKTETGGLLRSWQNDGNLSDHAAADMLGLSERTYQRWRDGNCQYPKLVALALMSFGQNLN